jgi:hypothetical protein
MHNNVHIVGAYASAANREPLGAHPAGLGHKFSARALEFNPVPMHRHLLNPVRVTDQQDAVRDIVRM